MACWAPLPRVRIYGFRDVFRQGHFSRFHCGRAPVRRASKVPLVVMRRIVQLCSSSRMAGTNARTCCKTIAATPLQYTVSGLGCPAPRPFALYTLMTRPARDGAMSSFSLAFFASHICLTLFTVSSCRHRSSKSRTNLPITQLVLSLVSPDLALVTLHWQSVMRGINLFSPTTAASADTE